MADQRADSKAKIVRDYLQEHPKATPAEVEKALGSQGIKARYVSKIKAALKQSSGKGQTPKKEEKVIKNRPAKDKLSPAKGSPWTFPKNTLEDAIRVPKAIEEKNAGNPMDAPMLARAVGFKLASDWRFLDLLRSANLYGLVSGAGSTAKVSMEKLGQDIVVPSSPQQRQAALLAAFDNVPDFKGVAKFYGGKKIPDDEFFLNTLTRQFNIPRDRVSTFAEVFITNLKFLRAFDVSQKEVAPLVGGASPISAGEPEPSTPIIKRTLSREPRVREYLDTCFVMMPFGEWFDRYYQDIYIPAIKEAGFEPVRADELFGSGSVVEQIWEQVMKAKVLLAELTGKNANVFYELGLAHAAKRPVVFTAAQVEDVPFDLRHLRVIVYETKEPEWASKLRQKVTEYLKNAHKEPEKSIPHPFRGETEE
jgi:hypothetical protein